MRDARQKDFIIRLLGREEKVKTVQGEKKNGAVLIDRKTDTFARTFLPTGLGNFVISCSKTQFCQYGNILGSTNYFAANLIISLISGYEIDPI